MTKVKLPYNHNGKRPPAKQNAAGRATLISSRMRMRIQPKGHQTTTSTITLVFISSLLICCSFGDGLLSAKESSFSPEKPTTSAAAAAARQRQVNNSISDSSSSHRAVSNPSVRSQQQQQQRQSVQLLQFEARTPAQSERASSSSESKNHLNRLLVERDLSTTENDAPPSNNGASSSNNNEPPPGEGPLNGDETPADSASADDSAIDYETSEAESPSSSSAAPEPPQPEFHARPSRQSVDATTATTTTPRRPTTTAAATTDKNESTRMQFVSNSRGGISLQPSSAVVALSTVNEPPPSPPTTTTFNVNMGSDRLLIKPYNPVAAIATIAPRRNYQSTTPPTTPTPIAVSAARATKFRNQEPLTSESVNHEFITTTTTTTTRNPQTRSQQHFLATAPNTPTNINERRQDLLLYPASNNYNSNNNNNIGDDSSSGRPTTFMPRTLGGFSGSQLDQDLLSSSSAAAADPLLQQQQASICYTPVALLLVVLMTMMTTLAVCLCTHFLFKHYARRNQFDLVASSRQFDTNKTDHWPAAALASQKPHGGTSSKPNSTGNSSNLLLNGLFAADHGRRRGGQSSTAIAAGRDDEFAFDNPYFRDEQIRQQQQQVEQQQQQQSQHYQQAAAAAAGSPICAASEAPPGGSEQMHSFIQHHISNLHTRQVTSSVKELSGANNNQPAAQRDLCGGGEQFQVVDLTSPEQRNKIIADPKEGDLIAVEITGHDFIGLGFDVCGSQQEGIFVRSLLARGPAKESGCIEVGDRIKCLNISFDAITLQDAREILNCGAPYKMRLLLEKRAAALVAPARNRASKSSSALALLDNHQNSAGNKQPSIKACLKKLGNFVGNRAPFDYEHQLTRANLSEQQLAGHEIGAGADWLGSAAARQQRALAMSPFAHVGGGGVGGQVMNLGFGGSEIELAHSQRGDAVDNLRGGRLLSSADSGGGGGGFNGRRNSSTQQPPSERADSSLEHFHTQNANHRLHGPGGNNLHLVMDANTSDDDLDHEHDDRNQRRRRRSHDLGAHLEQTQSQPEIAPRAQQQFLGGKNKKDPPAGQFGIDLDDDRANNHEHIGSRADQQLQNHKSSSMLTSISTPTMNLLPLTHSTGLERRMSSRRRRKQEDSRAAINEEEPLAAGGSPSRPEQPTEQTR